MKTNLQLPVSLPLPKLHVWSEADNEQLRLLSTRFSPPQVDLEEARRLDPLTREIMMKKIRTSKRHQTIDDILLSELDRFYDFCYMQPGDLIFYLYPFFSAFIDDPKIDSSDFYLYSFEHLFSEILNLLNEKEEILLQQAFQVMYERSWFVHVSGSLDNSSESLNVEILSDLDFDACPQLLRFIGVYLNPTLNC